MGKYSLTEEEAMNWAEAMENAARYVVACYKGIYTDKVYYVDTLAEAQEIASRNEDCEILVGVPGNYKTWNEEIKEKEKI